MTPVPILRAGSLPARIQRRIVSGLRGANRAASGTVSTGSIQHAVWAKCSSRNEAVPVLSENWTLTPPRDLRTLVRMAVEAEQAGFDAVMVSEHNVPGPGSDSEGLPRNARDYALPGNRDPRTPWPSSIVLLSAVAAATTRLRLIASAIIPPLRHPLSLAKELATLDLLSEGRLVVHPTVSWHEAEYEALGMPVQVAWAAARRAPRRLGRPVA